MAPTFNAAVLLQQVLGSLCLGLRTGMSDESKTRTEADTGKVFFLAQCRFFSLFKARWETFFFFFFNVKLTFNRTQDSVRSGSGSQRG